MMNDAELNAVLDAIHADLRRPPAPPELHERVLAVPYVVPCQPVPLILPDRFQTMFSAAKFAVASAIVALFGGFLLVGMLMQPSADQVPAVGASASVQAASTDIATASPDRTPDAEADMQTETSVRSDILPGVDLTVEEVEPGVLRVVSDGLRGLSWQATEERNFGGIFDAGIVAGLDGSVWWLGPDGFFRLGEEDSHAIHWDPELVAADIEIGPDGTPWLSLPWTSPWTDHPRGGIWSYDGERWTDRRQGSVAKRTPVGVEVDQDGTVWSAWVNESERIRLARLGDAGWELLPGRLRVGSADADDDLVVSEGSGSDVWLVPGDPRGLFRHDGEGWVAVPTPEVGGAMRAMRAAVGADGTLWVRLGDYESGESDVLARFDGSEWEVFDSSAGIPMMGSEYMGVIVWPRFFEVAPDGSIWFSRGCEGIASFDGESLTQYLQDHCISGADTAPDGTVWITAVSAADWPPPGKMQYRNWSWTPTDPTDTYVITPEAAGANQ